MWSEIVSLKITKHAGDIWEDYFNGNYSNHTQVNKARNMWIDYTHEVAKIYTEEEVLSKLPKENVLDALMYTFRKDIQNNQ